MNTVQNGDKLTVEVGSTKFTVSIFSFNSDKEYLAALSGQNIEVKTIDPPFYIDTMTKTDDCATVYLLERSIAQISRIATQLSFHILGIEKSDSLTRSAAANIRLANDVSQLSGRIASLMYRHNRFY